MREMAKVNYLIHPPISGTVTLSTQGNISTDDAVYMLENALRNFDCGQRPERGQRRRTNCRAASAASKSMTIAH
jgi:hypothetical protein